MATTRRPAATRAAKKPTPVRKSTARPKDLTARDAARVKGGARRRIIPCV